MYAFAFAKWLDIFSSFIHPLKNGVKRIQCWFFFLFSGILYACLFFIYITMNLFLILITGGLEIFLEKKSLNVSVKLRHQINDITSITAKWQLFASLATIYFIKTSEIPVHLSCHFPVHNQGITDFETSENNSHLNLFLLVFTSINLLS